jgi:hypothetical protein
MRLRLHADHRSHGRVPPLRCLFITIGVVVWLGLGRGFVCHDRQYSPARLPCQTRAPACHASSTVALDGTSSA